VKFQTQGKVGSVRRGGANPLSCTGDVEKANAGRSAKVNMITVAKAGETVGLGRWA